MAGQTYQAIRYKQAQWRVVVVFAIGVLITMSGLFFWLRSEITAQAHQKAATTIHHFDGIFASIDDMSVQLKRYRSLPCRQLRQMMASRALHIPSSLAIEVKTPSGYCSSLNGNDSQPVLMLADSQVLGFSNGYSLPNVLYYRPDADTVVELNLRYFLERLAVAPTYVHLEMSFTRNQSINHMADETGSSLERLVVASPRYPYVFIATFQYLDMFEHNYVELMVALLCLITLPWLIARCYYRMLLNTDWLAKEIKLGIEQGEFKAYVQPIMDSQHRVIYGEVLVRWHHRQYGVIPPVEFIELLEKANLASLLSSTLFTQVIAKLTPHMRTQTHDFHLSFNLSAQQLLNRHIITDCQRFIQAMNNKHIHLILELTEREPVINSESVYTVYQELYQLGVRFAIDNFGVGNASLFYMQMFSVDYIKLDQKFIELIGSHSVYQEAIRHVLDLAKRLKIPSVAVGVENHQQFTYLQESGVDYYQGYLFSKPIPVNDFLNEWLI